VGIRTASRGKIPEPSDEFARLLHPEEELQRLEAFMTRTLLVEDSADVLDILRIQLEFMGYEVEAAIDGGSALAASERQTPDVIVSDLGMPGMDGFEFMRCIRTAPALAPIPAIALTGASCALDVQRALAVGFTEHLTKPVEAADLRSRIEVLTDQRLQRKAG
jgi:two-component system CheB/CheR fusion protein